MKRSFLMMEVDVANVWFLSVVCRIDLEEKLVME